MHPYRHKPDYAFWRRAVSGRSSREVDPVTAVPFHIAQSDKIATGGSCFAQYISKTLSSIGFGYLVTETGPVTPGATNENYGVFPARFGNLYTARQLVQLFQRAYGVFEPADSEWVATAGGYVDPFRPLIQQGGFESVERLRADRESHLASVREMFEQCDVFIFTLGLTEGWRSTVDGAMFPLAPGVVSEKINPSDYEFHNFTVGEVEADLLEFVDLLRSVNPTVRIILTVSPVPLIATFEERHVLVSTVYSKCVLRVAAETITRCRPDIAYFPSYELITGPQARSQFYQDDLREVSADGVEHVMSIFIKHYVPSDGASKSENADPKPSAASASHLASSRASEAANMREWQQVICDEITLDVPR